MAVLATVDGSGAPHLVPVTFAVEPPASPPAPSVSGRSDASAVPGASAPLGAPASSLPGPPASTGPPDAPVVLWSATDTKPKRGTQLRRHVNIRAYPSVSLLVQHWDERWDALWWVRADGVASLVDESAAVAYVAGLLREKYRQYEHVGVTGPLIRVEVRAWQGWAAASR